MSHATEPAEITNADLVRPRCTRRAMPKEDITSARVVGWQRELKATIDASLARTTGLTRQTVFMPYTVTALGTHKYLFRYGVRLVGWLAEVPFGSPGEIFKPLWLCSLIRGFRHGSIYFERLGQRELARLAAAHGSTVLVCMTGHMAWREDSQSGSQVRRWDKLSKKKASRRPRTIKTTAEVDSLMDL